MAGGDHGPDAKLWTSSYESSTATLHRLADRLKLGHLASTPACLRVEGATYYAIEGLDLGRLQFLGRWQSTTSLAAYLQESASQLIWLKVRGDEQQRISALVQQGLAVCLAPSLVAMAVPLQPLAPGSGSTTLAEALTISVEGGIMALEQSLPQYADGLRLSSLCGMHRAIVQKLAGSKPQQPETYFLGVAARVATPLSYL